MLFRFAATVVLITAVALTAIAVEKEILSLKRAISLQHYNLQILQEKRSRLILRTQELGAPLRLQEEQSRSQASSEGLPNDTALTPQLQWRLRQR